MSRKRENMCWLSHSKSLALHFHIAPSALTAVSRAVVWGPITGLTLSHCHLCPTVVSRAVIWGLITGLALSHYHLRHHGSEQEYGPGANHRPYTFTLPSLSSWQWAGLWSGANHRACTFPLPPLPPWQWAGLWSGDQSQGMHFHIAISALMAVSRAVVWGPITVEVSIATGSTINLSERD